MSISVTIHTRGFIRELLSPKGPMGIDLLRRGKRVERQAKQLAPKDTGRMARNIRTRVTFVGARLTCLVEAPDDYAIFQHEGTGIHGPRGRMIVAAPGRVFVWTDKASGETVFATKTRGVPATKFLERALPAAAG